MTTVLKVLKSVITADTYISPKTATVITVAGLQLWCLISVELSFSLQSSTAGEGVGGRGKEGPKTAKPHRNTPKNRKPHLTFTEYRNHTYMEATI